MSRNDRYKAQLVRKQTRVVKKAGALQFDNSEDGNSDGKHYNN